MIRLALILSLLFADGFEARALEPADIKSISIDKALPVQVDGVAVDRNGLLTASTSKPPVPPQPVCKPIPTGYKVFERTWEQMVGAKYPSGPSWQQPIGSFTSRSTFDKGGLPAAGRINTASFVADGGLHKIGWLGAQAVNAAGYGQPQSAAAMFVSISPCRGDVYSACSGRARSGSLFYGVRADNPACVVTPGQTYWLTVGGIPPSLDPKANTCAVLNASGGVLCDGNFEAL